MDSPDCSSSPSASATGECPTPHKPKCLTMKVALPSRGVRIKPIKTVDIPATIPKPSRTSSPNANPPPRKPEPSMQPSIRTIDLTEEPKAIDHPSPPPPASRVKNPTTLREQVAATGVAGKSSTLTLPASSSDALTGKFLSLIPQITALGLAGKSLILIPQIPLTGKVASVSVTQPVQTPGRSERSKPLTPQVRSHVGLAEKPASLTQPAVNPKPKPKPATVQLPVGTAKILTPASVRLPAGTVMPLTPLVRPPAATAKPMTPPVRPPAAMAKPMTPPVRPPAAMAKPMTPPVRPLTGTAKPLTPPVRPPTGTPKPLTPPVPPPTGTPKPLTPPVPPPTGTPKPLTPLVPPPTGAAKPLTQLQPLSVPTEKSAGVNAKTGVPARESKSQPPPSTTQSTTIGQPEINSSSSAKQTQPVDSAQPIPVDPSKYLPPPGYYTQPAKERPTNCGMCNVVLGGVSAGTNYRIISKDKDNREIVGTWIDVFFKFKPEYYESGESIRLCKTCHQSLSTVTRVYRKFVERVHKNGVVEPRISINLESQDKYRGEKTRCGCRPAVAEVATQTDARPEPVKAEREKPILKKLKEAEKRAKGKQVIANYFKRKLREEMFDVCKYSSLSKDSSDPDYKLPPNDLIFDELETYAPNVSAALEGLCLKHYKFISNPPEYKVNAMVTVLGVAMGARNKHCSSFQKWFGYVLWKTGGSIKAFQDYKSFGLSLTRTAMLDDLNKTNRGAIAIAPNEDDCDDEDTGENSQNVSESEILKVKIVRPKHKTTVKQSVFSLAATPKPEKLARDRRTAHYWMKKKKISEKQLGINEKKRKAELGETWPPKSKRYRK